MDQKLPKKFKKKKRLSWDEFFMEITVNASKRTACLFHQIAAVFVDENHRIISIGYNGPSKNDFHCNEVGCAKIHGDPVTGKIRRCRGVHAEINAIINAGDTAKLRGATLYSVTFPCYDCMKALNNLSIKKIVYLNEYLRIVEGSDGKKKEAEPEARELAEKRGILIEKFKKGN
ncbi:MAG: deaminase [Patescibacteria group bacterium]|nr:deaminase [Patescibacteria group bacterium]